MPIQAATNPQDYSIPKPGFSIGDQVKFTERAIAQGSLKYFLGRLLRHEIKSVRRFRNERPMLAFNKDQIRAKLAGAASAIRIDIAGMEPVYGQNVGAIANECYLSGVLNVASPMEFQYFLCFRWTCDNGNALAYVPTISLASGQNLELVVSEQESVQ